MSWHGSLAAATEAGLGEGSKGDIRLNFGVPLSWLKGCNPVLSQDQFAARWQTERVLYRVAEGQGARLSISLGTV